MVVSETGGVSKNICCFLQGLSWKQAWLVEVIKEWLLVGGILSKHPEQREPYFSNIHFPLPALSLKSWKLIGNSDSNGINTASFPNDYLPCFRAILCKALKWNGVDGSQHLLGNTLYLLGLDPWKQIYACLSCQWNQCASSLQSEGEWRKATQGWNKRPPAHILLM